MKKHETRLDRKGKKDKMLGKHSTNPPHMLYTIRDREAGNVIDTFISREDAEGALAQFEADDKAEGTYEPNFYEITEDEDPEDSYE